VPYAAGRSLHAYRRAVTCDAASGRRPGETVDRRAGHTAPDWRPSKAAFNCCGSTDYYAPARHD